MGKIHYEKEVVQFLNIPSIPKKEFDGKTSFTDGVAVVNLRQGDQAYAVATFDKETDKAPKIKKVFSQEPFIGVDKIFVVPSYMDNDTESVDLDTESKKKAEELAREAKELEDKGTKDEALENANNLPEWIFPEIQNREQAQAYIKEYNRVNKIKKAKIPNNDDTIKMRLYAIYMENLKRNKK